MRYQSWDVLIFPDQSKIPQQEFKTTCQVVQDPELRNLYSNRPLLPTVTCFIPSLEVGHSFRISIHSWENPVASRHTLELEGLSERFSFEARVFIDGEKFGSTLFDSEGPWPTVIEKSIEVGVYGEFEPLKFPTFHKELLSQSYWSPVDDLGRVKVVIAEGIIRRKNPTNPFERTRNIISFSFQHAPLDLLEKSSIAWPNPSMWQNATSAGPFYSRTYSEVSKENVKTHNQSRFHFSTKDELLKNFSSMYPLKGSVYENNVNDPFTGSENLFTDPINPSLKYWNDCPAGPTLPGHSSLSSYTPMTNTPTYEVKPPEDASGTLGVDLSAVAFGKISQNIPEIKYSPQTLATESSPRNNEMDLFSLDPGIFGSSKIENSCFLEQITDIELDYSDSSIIPLVESNLSSSITSQSHKRARTMTPVAAQDIDGENDPASSSINAREYGTPKIKTER